MTPEREAEIRAALSDENPVSLVLPPPRVSADRLLAMGRDLLAAYDEMRAERDAVKKDSDFYLDRAHRADGRRPGGREQTS